MSTPAESMSPAERYAADARRRAFAKTELGAFAATVEFALDDFQVEACKALEAGRGVLVAAPTGAGKTIVGEFAVHLALSQGLKAFYTTPIKALSNQKYSELCAVHGVDRVGLLTGDTSINGEAPVVVMTTEVLRNMLYADSDTLTDLGYVVMDEVHYLADRFRGAVWEEVIIHLPRAVRVVSLSATVSNAEEFGAWLDTVRGETAIIVSEHRPVPLWQHVLVGRQLVDLFATRQSFEDLADVHDHDGGVSPGGVGSPDGDAPREGGVAASSVPAARPPAPRSEATVSELTAVNPELAELARRESQQLYRGRFGHGGRSRRREERQRGEKQSPRTGRPGDAPPLPGTRASRPQTVQALERRGLLPAIDFIFSRAGCEAAVQQCLDASLDLTTPAEKAEISAAVEAAAADIPPADLPILGFWAWRDGLQRGLAAHHAGLLPTFKETVEKLFAAGLVKVVFATETLALGINMPAKSVLIEKLEKFNGEAHVDITAGEYTQLTGRAGRRGIDIEGHAVVQWRPGLDPAALAGLASRRTYPLNSSFRPTYNMSINLVAQFGRERARDILESSFAQFQADRSVVGLARQVRSREESLAGYEKAMTCHLGDFTEYSRIRQELNDAEKSASREAGRARRAMTVDSLSRLVPGDVVEIGEGRLAGSAVVLNADTNAREPRPQVLTFDRNLRRIGLHDVAGPVEPLTRIRIPKHFDAKRPKDRRDLAASLHHAVERVRLEGPEQGARARRSRRDFAFAGGYQDSEQRITDLRRQLRAHPCNGCADREEHARWAERWIKLRRETDRLVEQIQGRTNTIAKTFDRVCEVLESYGCLARGADGLAVTPAGQQLRRIYGDKDMLTALSLRGGAFDDVDAAEIAALVSTLVYHAKREERGLTPKMPSISLDVAVDVVLREWSQLEDAEEQHRLPRTSEPDFGLVWPIYKWARGRDLQNVLSGTELAAGDFVRWVRQVIDLLDQLADVPGLEPRLSRLCHESIGLLRRGVVAYSAVSD
ncbi:DEAD/DEAH box helicase [Sinomonas sp. ASV486]|uniref:DEAD/DEAH box helicase n=1 Tax=Sinomonas puerhi TaxID=3238584 RepID=A0AB39LAG9_9MICC|nr:DEAD/DEAH box helicase [Sinomonas sp. ASV486]MDQ4491385.1 DEAD/DEAH box helicase [Sinomonas sp. ASV486]